MKFIEQSIPGVFVLEPRVFPDSRGYFFESYREDLFQNSVRPIRFVQDNESSSTRGVLRGLHYQLPPFAQSKLVRTIQGTILDVIVDIRRGSPYFGRHIMVELSGENHRHLFIPRGFAHGFLVLSESATLAYKVDNYYSKECDRGLLWNDPLLKIKWPFPESEILLSEKDRLAPGFDHAEHFRADDLYA